MGGRVDDERHGRQRPLLTALVCGLFYAQRAALHLRCSLQPLATSTHPAALPPSVQPRPKPIGMRYPLAWVTSTVSAPEAAVIKFAGVDALMYM